MPGLSSSATGSKWDIPKSPDVTIASSLVSSEAKNGLRYRFDHKETRAGEEEKTVGTAKLEGEDKGGAVEFDNPSDKKIKLPPRRAVPDRAYRVC